ncbi:apolipoprotein N-acyltransferase [Geobacter sp. DSM 9736]|uniref:apolipoprotein N-acyltransferase n=1 Tax=Geobacter sp. DSM 9736 TaxID=1277350 RepID=UPI000B5135AF|nr:apolipoprotein N-acyltransferase [Geobacter sp. DSM 9736]SNB44997.1 Apolipoprotein N-acyltransferase [Geobacter sp. DSM 9736]
MAKRRFKTPGSKGIQRRDYLLALLSGVLLALSFPKPGLSLLAWFAFVPLLLALGRKSPKDAFKLGFTTGMAAYAGILYWLNIVMVTYGKLNWGVSGSLYLVLSAYLALYVGIVTWAVARGTAAGISPFLSFPVFWVSMEYLRSFLLTGFPWASLGYSQFKTLPLIQVADVTGVYGLSFLVVMGNVLLYLILRAVAGRDKASYPTREAVLFLLLLVVTLGYGFSRLNRPDTGKPIKVSLIQGNIAQDVKWNPAFQEETVAIYERLSRRPETAGSDLVIWPESAAPFFFQDDARYADRIRKVASGLKTNLVTGSPAYDMTAAGPMYFNSAFLIGADGRTMGRSDKIHLVPFGEYVPMARLLPFVNKLVTGIGDFSPGAAAVPLDIGKGRIGILICFEGIFPELAREYVREGSRVLVNISNDAWYKRSSAPHQHLSMTVFRAVENRVPLVRSTNTGISAIIDSKGHIRGMTPLFEEAVLAGEVRSGEGGSLYTAYGDFFAIACLLLGGITLVTGLVRLKTR